MTDETQQKTEMTPDRHPVLMKLREQFGDKIVEAHMQHGDVTAIVAPDVNVDVLVFLRDDPDCDFNFLVDICGVDYHPRAPRFEVVYHMLSMRRRDRIRIKCQLSGSDPTIASITLAFPAANWSEREAWDMFGINFTGHPDMRRILMYEEFKGHPLRKDYPINKRQPLVEERPIKDAWVPQR